MTPSSIPFSSCVWRHLLVVRENKLFCVPSAVMEICATWRVVGKVKSIYIQFSPKLDNIMCSHFQSTCILDDKLLRNECYCNKKKPYR